VAGTTFEEGGSGLERPPASRLLAAGTVGFLVDLLLVFLYYTTHCVAISNRVHRGLFSSRRGTFMKLTVLGSGTLVPDAERGSPGLAIEAGGRVMFLDIGSGSLYRARKAAISIEQLDLVLLTHLHPDHTGDLVPALFAFHAGPMARTRRLLIAGPQGTKRFFEQLEALYGDWIAPTGYEREVREVEGETWEFDALRISSSPVAHGPPSIGYRIEEGRAGASIVYSGDTGYCASLVELARGADLLILECSFPDEQPVAGHLTPSLAGRIARESGSKRLMLTHFYPACRGRNIRGQCEKEYSGEIVLAEDLMELALTGSGRLSK
jgi:ribonuclease BN (tRNA processing enzyme)